MKDSPLMRIGTLGQSVWLDFISRDLIMSGALKRLIEEDGVSGMTSNPAIFEHVISNNNIYDEDIMSFAARKKTAHEIYEILSQRDVQNAADQFRNIYETTKGKDGYVSLEINPHLAHDVEGTIAEAHRLWQSVNRPNVLIKVPATDEGLIAIKRLISDAININVTLIFGIHRYQQVIDAYFDGLEARLNMQMAIKNITSVASFFISRIDSKYDALLEAIIAQKHKDTALEAKLRGHVAIANARTAYQIFRKTISNERFKKLASAGAGMQRLLWASTSTKNPNYSDIKYIESLIGPYTINTAPMETINAFRDHGRVNPRLEQNIYQSDWILRKLPELGINVEKTAKILENEGEQKFLETFDRLLINIDKKSHRHVA